MNFSERRGPRASSCTLSSAHVRVQFEHHGRRDRFCLTVTYFVYGSDVIETTSVPVAAPASGSASDNASASTFPSAITRIGVKQASTNIHCSRVRDRQRHTGMLALVHAWATRVGRVVQVYESTCATGEKQDAGLGRWVASRVVLAMGGVCSLQ